MAVQKQGRGSFFGSSLFTDGAKLQRLDTKRSDFSAVVNRPRNGQLQERIWRFEQFNIRLRQTLETSAWININTF